MNTKLESSPSTLDTVKLAVAVVVPLAGIVAYYYFADASILIRVAALVAGLAVGLGIASQTAIGREAWEFFQSSQGEIRKVVWPTQQETMQTTLLVLVFTLIMGVFFLAVDSVLLKLTQFVTGQGG
jgi:preprotein translocase subunit SecE